MRYLHFTNQVCRGFLKPEILRIISMKRSKDKMGI